MQSYAFVYWKIGFGLWFSRLLTLHCSTQMYGRYTKDLGEYAKDEARKLKILERRRKQEDKHRNKVRPTDLLFQFEPTRNRTSAHQHFAQAHACRLMGLFIYP